jgi:HEAT repeat protein
MARVVHLMRTAPDDPELQRQAFLQLLAGLGTLDHDLAIGADVGGLTVDGKALPQGTPFGEELHGQFSAHGIGLLTIPPGIPAAPLMILMRTLARPRGEIRSAKAFFGLLDPEGARLVTVRGQRELPRADNLIDFDSFPPETGGFNAAPAEPEIGAEQVPFWQETSSAGDDLRRVQLEADGAIRRGDWPQVLSIMARIVQDETNVTDPVQRRRHEQVVRGLGSRPVIRALAALSGEGTRESVSTVLQHIGAEATAALLDLMASADTIKDRREYFTLLTQMREGTDAIVNRLNDEQWYILRNVAELCGELRLAEAAPRLAVHIEHPDARVRRAVAGALAKSGSTQAAAPLRKMLHDSEPTVRLQAVQSLEGQTAKALSMTLAVLLDEESHPDVQRELHLALGRIGSSEALQALVRSSKPGRAFFGRKPTELRLAAVEGLLLCDSPGAHEALRELAEDRDVRVRDAARSALGSLDTLS